MVGVVSAASPVVTEERTSDDIVGAEVYDVRVTFGRATGCLVSVTPTVVPAVVVID